MSIANLSVYNVSMVIGGAICLGGIILRAPTIVAKVKGLLSHLKLGHFLWINLCILSVWIFRRRGSDQLAQNPIDAAALIRILSVAFTGVIIFAIGFINRKGIIRQLLKGLPGIMFVYGLVGVFSTFYSRFPMLSLYKSCEIIVDVGIIAFFLSSYPSQLEMKRWIDLSWFIVALLIALVWIEAIILPGRAFRPISAYEFALDHALFPIQLHGILPPTTPNGVGFLAATLSVISLSRALNVSFHKDRIIYIISFLVGMVTLILAQARTSFIGGMLAIMTVLLLSKRIKPLIFIILLFIILSIYVDIYSPILEYILRGQTPKQFQSLSGRMNWWSVGWKYFTKSPIYGYGFGAGVRYVVFSDIGKLFGSTIHNSWLEVLVNLGIIGMIPVAITFLGTWYILLRINIRPFVGLNPITRMLSIEMTAFWVLQTVRLSFGGGSFMHERETLLLFLVIAFAQQLRNWEKSYKLNGVSNANHLGA